MRSTRASARSDPGAGVRRGDRRRRLAVHLEKMYAFWSSVMLTSGRYKGDPVATHRKLADVAPPMFGEWLDLFEATATELFIPTSLLRSSRRRGASRKA